MSVPAGTKGDGDDLRILILAPSGRDARLAEQTLARSGLSRQVCADFDQLRREITSGAGAVLIAGEALPQRRDCEPGGLDRTRAALVIAAVGGAHGASDLHRLSQPCVGWNTARR